MDIYRAAKRRGKYPTLDTDTEVNSQGRSQKKLMTEAMSMEDL